MSRTKEEVVRWGVNFGRRYAVALAIGIDREHVQLHERLSRLHHSHGDGSLRTASQSEVK
jgi:hypothetical protein